MIIVIAAQVAHIVLSAAGGYGLGYHLGRFLKPYHDEWQYRKLIRKTEREIAEEENAMRWSKRMNEKYARTIAYMRAQGMRVVDLEDGYVIMKGETYWDRSDDRWWGRTFPKTFFKSKTAAVDYITKRWVDA